MRALDTSVTVPALVSWHEAHDAVTAALRPGDRLPEHVALETYAVLSRLPAPYRLSAAAAGEVLRRRFPPPYLAMSADRRAELVTILATANVAGDAAYDGLVGLTAVEQGATLLSRDSRARSTYARLGVDVYDV